MVWEVIAVVNIGLFRIYCVLGLYIVSYLVVFWEVGFLCCYVYFTSE